MRPKMPPPALISSMAINSASIIDFSLIAIAPVRECRRPSLIGGRTDRARATYVTPASARSTAPPNTHFRVEDVGWRNTSYEYTAGTLSYVSMRNQDGSITLGALEGDS